MPESECLTCRNAADPAAPPSESILRTGHWRVAHVAGTAVPGWLVLVPLRHVTALDELAPDEAAELGPLLVRLTAALRAETGCTKTYVAMFAEAEGYSHVHFHVVPRPPDMPHDVRGPRVFSLLGASDRERVSDAAVQQLAARLHAALAR